MFCKVKFLRFFIFYSVILLFITSDYRRALVTTRLRRSLLLAIDTGRLAKFMKELSLPSSIFLFSKISLSIFICEISDFQLPRTKINQSSFGFRDSSFNLWVSQFYPSLKFSILISIRLPIMQKIYWKLHRQMKIKPKE